MPNGCIYADWRRPSRDMSRSPREAACAYGYYCLDPGYHDRADHGPIAQDHPDFASESIHILRKGGSATCNRPESAACQHGTYVAGVVHAKRSVRYRVSVLVATCWYARSFRRTRRSQRTMAPRVPTCRSLCAPRSDRGGRSRNLSVGLDESVSRSLPSTEHSNSPLGVVSLSSLLPEIKGCLEARLSGATPG